MILPKERIKRTPILTPSLVDPKHHNLWYSSRQQSSSLPLHLLNNPTATHDPIATTTTANHNGGGHHLHHPHPRDRDRRRALVERTLLSRLRQDELLMDRRRHNVANYGSAWLKPPGVPKTLFQMREERREAEEHAEQVRRERQLAAALEAEGGAAGPEEDETLGAMEDDDEEGYGEGGEEQDLDDEIPEAEGFGFDGEDDSEEEEEDEDEDEEDEENQSVGGNSLEGDDEGHAGTAISPAQQAQIRNMRAAEDRMRELMARGHDDLSGAGGGDPFLDADEDAHNHHYAGGFQYPYDHHHHRDDNDDERAGQMLEEDDLIQHHQYDGAAASNNIGDVSMGMGMDMDMDADLDDGIPEASDDDVGHGYEHTDSEEDLSDDDGTREISFAGRSTTSGSARTASVRRRAPNNNNAMLRQSLQSRASLVQSDIDISGLLSRDGSSFLGDTPQTGPRRRG